MPSQPPRDFAAYILTHRRPERREQRTLRAIERCGYTGPVYLVVDDEDPTLPEYIEEYGDQVVVFPKQATIDSFDIGDNFGGSGSVVPRNAISDIAREHGHRYFTQLDDDYITFRYRFNADCRPVSANSFEIRDLNKIFTAFVKWLAATPPEVHSLAFGQGGDFLGGSTNAYLQYIHAKRKAMNTFICDTERQFLFPGRRNEDVNCYTELQRRGIAFFSTFQVIFDQSSTQTQSGGMTEMYEQEGTYQKSFTSVMRCPSGVKVSHLADRNKNPRIHHRVTYKHVAPEFVPASHRKPR